MTGGAWGQGRYQQHVCLIFAHRRMRWLPWATGFREAAACARKVLEGAAFNNVDDPARFRQVGVGAWQPVKGGQVAGVGWVCCWPCKPVVVCLAWVRLGA